MLEEHQERALNLLADLYEKSPAFRGEARVHRSFRIAPGKVWPGYQDDYTPVETRDRFEWEMTRLEGEGLVELVWDRPPRHELKAIRAREDAWERIYQALGRRDGKSRQREELAFYETAGETEVTRRFARQEAERLRNYRAPRWPMEKARMLICLTDRIVNNHEFLLERELSMDFFHDSKTFEKHWRRPVVELLLAWGDREYPVEAAEETESEREKQAIVLAEHGVEANPSYIFLKGDLTLCFQDGSRMQVPPGLSVALQTPALEKLESVRTTAAFVMTVENLTAYHRVEDARGLFLFLSGFHHRGMEKLMKQIDAAYPDMAWKHFGDLDPAGIQILKRLRRATGLSIAPWHMGLEDLETWKDWGKPLESHDLARLKSLREDPEWAEEARWMEQHGLKLEQEWIAWDLSQRGLALDRMEDHPV